MILRVEVEEVEQVKVDLSAMVRRVRLSSKLNIALLIAIEDISCGAESGEDLAQLIMLVRLKETSGNFVHGGHWAAGRHVDPQSREEAKDATIKVLGVHHNVHLVLGVAWVDSICKTSVIIVPLHHEGASSVVLGMFVGRPSRS